VRAAEEVARRVAQEAIEARAAAEARAAEAVRAAEEARIAAETKAADAGMAAEGARNAAQQRAVDAEAALAKAEAEAEAAMRCASALASTSASRADDDASCFQWDGAQKPSHKGPRLRLPRLQKRTGSFRLRDADDDASLVGDLHDDTHDGGAGFDAPTPTIVLRGTAPPPPTDTPPR